MSTLTQPNPWDKEYQHGGIPSSVRSDPSGVLLWALSTWPHLTGQKSPASVLDVGCGAGRNALYMASQGMTVTAFDSSVDAITLAKKHLRKLTLTTPPQLLLHDLNDGLPVESASVDLVSDIFVYKHQLLPDLRKTYRAELRRVLRPQGRLLLSLADKTDGYYSSCPTLPPSSIEPNDGPVTIIDPAVNIGSILFSFEALQREMVDFFDCEMLWRKIKRGPMHGAEFRRVTLATVWRLR